MSVRPIDAWKENWPASTGVRRGARRVPRSHAREKKKEPPAAERRARRKRREKNISAGAKAREGKKLFFGRERKKILASTRTQPTKMLTYSRDVFFFYLFLSGVSTILEGAATIGFFLKVNAKDKKYMMSYNHKNFEPLSQEKEK